MTLGPLITLNTICWQKIIGSHFYDKFTTGWGWPGPGGQGRGRVKMPHCIPLATLLIDICSFKVNTKVETGWFEEIINLKCQTSSHTDEILSGRLVDLDVSITDVMFVTLDGHVTVGRVLEQDQGFTIPATLIAQTESYATSIRRNKVLARVTIFFKNFAKSWSEDKSNHL